MKMTRLPVSLTLFGSLLLWYAVPVRAQWTDSGTGVQQYLTTSNWAGGTINDTFLNVTNNGLDLRFSGNHTTTGTWNLGFNVNQNVTL